MSVVTIYHNPRCSKSRQTLALIEAQGIQPDIVLYLKTPPSRSKLNHLLRLLNCSPRDLMRTSEDVYKQLKLAEEDRSDDQLIQAMLDNPILIERPIVETASKARIGRPPESVLEIL